MTKETQKRIDYIKNNPQLSRWEIQRNLGITKSNVANLFRRHIKSPKVKSQKTVTDLETKQGSASSLSAKSVKPEAVKLINENPKWKAKRLAKALKVSLHTIYCYKTIMKKQGILNPAAPKTATPKKMSPISKRSHLKNRMARKVNVVADKNNSTVFVKLDKTAIDKILNPNPEKSIFLAQFKTLQSGEALQINAKNWKLNSNPKKWAENTVGYHKLKAKIKQVNSNILIIKK